MTNILLITLDQFRADALGCAGIRDIATPHLDALAAEGARCAQHYAQAAPCGPGRASLYTGMYQFNHRVMANGTPLEAGFDNLALFARRQGYTPVVFGYTDQSVDPRTVSSADDPRLENYEEFLPGFDVALPLTREFPLWRNWLIDLGHPLPDGPEELLGSESQRPAEHSMSAFLTNHAMEWMSEHTEPWFAHLSYLRPHPPYVAAGHFSEMYAPDQMPTPIAANQPAHDLHRFLLSNPYTAAPTDPSHMAALMAQYYGMVSEVDSQLGRVFSHLRNLGQWEDTMVIVTSDHGEHLGDHGLIEKAGYFGASYHIPCVIKPAGIAGVDFVAGQTIDLFTENIDLFPTICAALGAPIPLQCDGLPLTDILRGNQPAYWRDAAHWEFDWRFISIGPGSVHDWPTDRRLERQHLTVRRDHNSAYVHFGDGSSLHFDLATDPTWHTLIADPAINLAAATALLTWRTENSPRGLSGSLISNGILGRPIT
jgi:arylsulfatase A-like enzyme